MAGGECHRDGVAADEGCEVTGQGLGGASEATVMRELRATPITGI